MDREELGLLNRYPAAPRRLLTVDEYHRMGEVGILTEDDRVELIEGELVAMAPIGSEHIAASNSLRSKPSAKFHTARTGWSSGTGHSRSTS